MSFAAAWLTTFPRTYSSQAVFQDTLSSVDGVPVAVVFLVSLHEARTWGDWCWASCQCRSTVDSIPNIL
eukprot:4825916-Pyramimonas_sp.AAC.1